MTPFTLLVAAVVVTLLVFAVLLVVLIRDEVRHWSGKRKRRKLHAEMLAMVQRHKTLVGDTFIDEIGQKWEAGESHRPHRIVRKVR